MRNWFGAREKLTVKGTTEAGGGGDREKSVRTYTYSLVELVKIAPPFQLVEKTY